MSGFSFIGLPEIVESGNDLLGLVFLGNRSKNDDIFYYEPEIDLLTQLTATPFSEKGFKLLKREDLLEIETSSLWARYRYAFRSPAALDFPGGGTTFQRRAQEKNRRAHSGILQHLYRLRRQHHLGEVRGPAAP